MPAHPYVYERQTEYWTSRRIEDFFLDEGFEVITFPLTQLSEADVPADFLFFDKKRTKLVGLQYKALYRNNVDHWVLNPDQHERLRHFPWIYYAASELREPREFRNALHRARFFSPAFPFTETLTPGEDLPYYRWGAFFGAFERCKVGQVISSRSHLNQVLSPLSHADTLTRELRELLPDVLLADFERRHLEHYSPILGR